MDFNTEWYSPNLGTPIVSIAEYGIGFNKASIASLESPEDTIEFKDKEKTDLFVLIIKIS